MDIHPPEHPIRSVRDFLIQIFTVTCGIIIALALDGLVTGRREAHLLRETRADFVGELNDNLAKLQQVRAMGDGNVAWLDKTINWAEARLAHQPGKNLTDPGMRMFPQFRNAAWETALATQAIRLMTFGEARALSTAYNYQLAMNEVDSRARDQWINLAAFGFDPDKASEADLHDALRQLRVASAYQHSLNTLEDKLIADYQAALSAVRKEQ